jgi:hypothetical protein
MTMTAARQPQPPGSAAKRPPRVKLASLTERKAAATGAIYFSGFIGNVRLLMFRDRDWSFDPSRPDALQGWTLFVEEATPADKAKRRAAAQPALNALDHDIERAAPKPTLANRTTVRKSR